MTTVFRPQGLTSGRIVHYVEEQANEYGTHDHLPALVQHVYEVDTEKGHVHLRVFEAYPQDDNAVDAYYSESQEPGTWHWIERA